MLSRVSENSVRLNHVRSYLRSGLIGPACTMLRSIGASTEEIVSLLPKVELHYHLDGAVRPETIFALSKEQGVDLRNISPRLPEGYTAENVRIVTSMQPGEKIEDFGVFLADKFNLALSVMQTESALTRIALEAINDAHADGILHREIIFAPCLHTENGLSYDQIINAVAAGLQAGNMEFGVTSSLRPAIYRNKVQEAGFEDHPIKTVEAAIRARDTHWHLPIAIDLVGNEAPFPPNDKRYRTEIELAARQNLFMSLHAGEQQGTAENVFYILGQLGVSRIGHGIDLTNHDLTLNQMALLGKAKAFEVCPTSNIMLGNVSDGYIGHPIWKMLELGLPVTVSTDDATVFNTTLTNELIMLEKNPGFRIFENQEVSSIYRLFQKTALGAAFMDESRRGQIGSQFKFMYDFFKIYLRGEY